MTASTPCQLRSLQLRSFRTFERLDLELTARVTVLTGPNGVGKTNLLESIAWLLHGQSPRTSSEVRCIRSGDTFFRVAGTLSCGDRSIARSVSLAADAGKRLTNDDAPVRTIDAFARQFPAVVFLPERLLTVRGAPARRRGTLDRFICRVSPGAQALLRDYVTALTQRNALLRRGKAGVEISELLVPWSRQIIELGGAVRALRASVMARLATAFTRRFEALTGFQDGSLEIVVRGDDLSVALAETRLAELRRGSTLCGPHLDDVLLRQGDRDLRTHGSTGEQRSALLAWAFAEADVLADTSGPPIMLLDEPFAELDTDRRARLAREIDGFTQVVLTTTEPPAELVPEHEGQDLAVLAIGSGTARPWHDSPTNPPQT